MRITRKWFLTLAGLTLLGGTWGAFYASAGDGSSDPAHRIVRIAPAYAAPAALTLRFAAYFDDDYYVAPKITAQQAADAALKVQPGTVTEIELESEHGRAVYEVHITASDGRRYEVNVDGDTAQVLMVIGRGSSVIVKITPQQAVDAALKVQPGMVTEIDLERERGRAIYEVRIIANDGRQYEVDVDGDTAQVLAVIGRGSNVIAGITPQQAVDAALKAQPGMATEIDLERERGRVVYEIRILANDGREFEVNVDAHTAQVLTVIGRGSSVIARITPQQALDVALTAVPGMLNQIDLERKDWRAVYEIRILANDGRQHEVHVDGDTAQILRVKVDGD